MEGLGISTASSSSKGGKRFNGDAKLKGKQHAEPPTTYTVSKIDAGQAVLISDQIHCIEFPSILLPPGCTTGSVISISCTRNQKEEQKRNDEFWDLQDDILSAFGERSPSPPRLRLRNVTQTSVTLEWDRLDLATSKLLSLTIWRNGQRLAAIPNPLNNTSTKVSGLDVDAPYSFHLIMRTTAGTYASQTIKTRTLTLADTSGIAVCFGAINPPELLEEAKEALTHMRARWSNKIQIETTHFVCTHPTGPAPAVTPPLESPREIPDPSAEYQRATQLSIPIVQPAWVVACLREKRMVPISAYTLDKTVPTSAPQSSSSLGNNPSSRSQTHVAQQPREGPREPIQLQKPPPPKHASPEVASVAPMPEAELQTPQDIQEAMPAVPAAPEEEAVQELPAVPAAPEEAMQEFAPVPTIAPTKFEEEEVSHDGSEEASPAFEEPAELLQADEDGEVQKDADADQAALDSVATSTTATEEVNESSSSPSGEVPAAAAAAEEPAEEASVHEPDNADEADPIKEADEVVDTASPSVEAEIAESFQSASEEAQPIPASPPTEETEADDEQLAATEASPVSATTSDGEESPKAVVKTPKAKSNRKRNKKH